MKKLEERLVILATIGTIIGVITIISRNWEFSSFVWNLTAVFLWVSRFVRKC